MYLQEQHNQESKHNSERENALIKMITGMKTGKYENTIYNTMGQSNV